MNETQKLSGKFKDLPVSKKIQLILAILATAALMISVPTIAWFHHQREIIKLQKVQSPNTLILSAMHHEDRMYFQIDGINADEIQVNKDDEELTGADGKPLKITHKDYVFGVVGEAVDQFTLQLAYTTNNPFTYQVFAAAESTTPPVLSADVEKNYVAYTPHGVNVTGLPQQLADSTTPSVLYYYVDTTVTEGGANGEYTGTYLNRGTVAADGSYDATSTYHNITYPSYNKVHKDAEPIYWQATEISAFPDRSNSEKEPFVRYFILRVSWQAGALNNSDKETDIVYITAKATK